MFLDESGAKLAMGRSHAWLPRGTVLVAPRPMNWGDNLTLVGAIRLSTQVIDGELNGRFECPTCCRRPSKSARSADPLPSGSMEFNRCCLPSMLPGDDLRHSDGPCVATVPAIHFPSSRTTCSGVKADRFIQQRTGKTPLDVGADRIACTAHAAFRIIGELRKKTGVAVPLD